jgi:hypothetical protein
MPRKPRSRRAGAAVSPTRIDVAKRRRYVLDALGRGMTYQEIADAVLKVGLAPKPYKGGPGPEPEPKYTRADAWNDAQRAMRAITEEPATQRKAIIARRLQESSRILMRDAQDVRLTPLDRARALSVLVRNMMREAKLFGLDEPNRTQLEITAHLDQLGALSAQAIQAGAEAAGLSTEQRAALIEGMQAFLLSVEAAEDGPQRLALTSGEVIEVEGLEMGEGA